MAGAKPDEGFPEQSRLADTCDVCGMDRARLNKAGPRQLGRLQPRQLTLDCFNKAGCVTWMFGGIAQLRHV